MDAIAYMILRTAGDIGALIRARRKHFGWDQATLAEKVGVSRLWINQMEAGKPSANLSLVLRTLAVLGLNVAAGEAAEQTNAAIASVPKIEIDEIVRAARDDRDG